MGCFFSGEKLFEYSKSLDYRTDIFRNIEDSYMLKDLELSSSDIYLDIRRGISGVSSLIGKLFKCKVITTDLDENYQAV
jgi:hypothetical protein